MLRLLSALLPLFTLVISGLSNHTYAQHRKVPADLLISRGWVVTMDADRSLIRNGAVAIREGAILAIGSADSIEHTIEAKKFIDASGSAVIPGLINTHTHIPMTLFRGLADDMELHRWLTEHIFPAEAGHVNEAFVRAGTRLGLAELILGGVTTFCDMYYFEDAIAEETARAGVRAVLGQTIIDFPAPDHKTPEEAIRYTEQFIRKWQGHPLIIPAAAPHSPYILSRERLRATTALTSGLLAPMVIHLSETSEENRLVEEQHGLSPTAYLASIDALNNRLIAAHAVHLSEADRTLISRSGAGIAHCPESNLKLASGIAPVPELLQMGIPVGLGTDGAASNNDLDFWSEIDMAAKIHKVHSGNPEAVPAGTAFAMATITGAKALHIDQLTGSLEPGKRADIAIVSLEGPHQQPLYDIYSALVYTTRASDVETVIVDGRVIMEKRELKTLDMQSILKETREYRRQIGGE